MRTRAAASPPCRSLSRAPRRTATLTRSQVFDDAARELVAIVDAVRRALEFAPGEDVPLSYSGGVFNAGDADPRAVPAPSRGAARRYRLAAPIVAPSGGAAIYAARLAGQPLRFGGHQAPGGLSTQCARAKR